MNRNTLLILLAVVAVVAIVLGVQLYREETEPALEIDVGENGVSVDTN